MLNFVTFFHNRIFIISYLRYFEIYSITFLFLHLFYILINLNVSKIPKLILLLFNKYRNK